MNTLLEKTYQILHQENIEKEEAVFQKPRKPEHSFHFNHFNIPQTRKINPQKVLLSKTLAFIDMKKFIRYTDKDGGFTVLPISCKSKRLLSMFNSQPQVTYFIDFMIEIGLLAEYDENYQFNAFYSKNNRVKEYVYSYETECKVKEYCSDNNINRYKVRNYNNSNNSINIRTIDNFDKSSVKFSSKLNLLKPDNWSVHQFEDYLTTCLYDNYPQLQHYQELADLINDVYYSEDVDRQIQFLPTFTWRKGNKCVISIGIRATNCLVSAKKEYEQGDENKNISGYKSEIFERYGLKYHYDVKSSVPRLTYFWNTGIWLDNSVDLYSRMYEKFVHYCPSEKIEWNETTRKVYKDFHMRGYFDNYSTIAGHIKRLISMKVEYKKDKWTNLDYLMKSYKKSIEETIGKTYDSEIFLHESCIYMDVLFELLKRGLEVWQVYDEWNTNEEVIDMNDIIKNKAEEYYNKYKEI